jgi:O-antigen ligase
VPQFSYRASGITGPRLTRTRLYALLSALLFVLTVVFTTVPSGFQYDLSDATEDMLSGSWIRRFQWMPLFLLAAYLLWRHRGVAWAFVRQVNPFLLALFLLMPLSMLWSPVPGVTLRRSVVLIGIALIGLSVHVSGWYPGRLTRLLYVSIGALILASAIAALFFPSLGVHQTGPFTGNWRGIRLDKNLLANLAALGVLLGAHAWLTAGTRRLFAAAYLALALLVLIMTGGKASLVATLTGVALMFVLARGPLKLPRYGLLIGALTAVLALGLILHLYSMVNGFPSYAEAAGPFFHLLGKDVTLTGRFAIWQWLLPIIGQHWLLGFGYGAFWLGDYGLSGEITQALNFYPWQAHNGYLEMLNELGVVGLTLMLAFFAYHLRQLARLRAIDHGAFTLHLPLLITILITNIADSSAFSDANLNTLALLFSSMAVSRLLWSAPANPLTPRIARARPGENRRQRAAHVRARRINPSR